MWMIKRAALDWGRSRARRAPARMRRVFASAATYLDLLFIDHGIFRLAYLNRHRLGDRAWRSAQPAPHDIRALARQGLRTIVNLRGVRPCGSYRLERASCERHGIALVDFHIRSWRAPTREDLRAARELFERVEYPMLMHCKSGADRTGLMSVLYCMLKEDVPLAEARKHLSPRYGHFRQTGSGILDHLFERYAHDNRNRPMPFFEWVETVYDPEALQRSFRARGWASRLADQVLRRE
jgi:protein tyrosine/serine phosphatase